MTEEKLQEQVEKDEKTKKKEEEALPFCTTAPSAEHSRGDEMDEPCDDFRSGDDE